MWPWTNFKARIVKWHQDLNIWSGLNPRVNTDRGSMIICNIWSYRYHPSQTYLYYCRRSRYRPGSAYVYIKAASDRFHHFHSGPPRFPFWFQYIWFRVSDEDSYKVFGRFHCFTTEKQWFFKCVFVMRRGKSSVHHAVGPSANRRAPVGRA